MGERVLLQDISISHTGKFPEPGAEKRGGRIRMNRRKLLSRGSMAKGKGRGMDSTAMRFVQGEKKKRSAGKQSFHAERKTVVRDY